jgi:hypothetical protein
MFLLFHSSNTIIIIIIIKQRTWNMKEEVIRNELQKTAILGTATLLREVLMQQHYTRVYLNHCNHRTAATLYTQETRFVSAL